MISLIAAAAAVTAVVMSKRALDYAKGEPLRAAQRALDGQLREKVNSLIKEVEDLQHALRFGKNIPEEAATLEESRGFLDELAQRRPNGKGNGRHRLTAATLRSLSVDWRSAVHNQSRVDEDEAYLEKRRAEGDTNLTERASQLKKDQRARDAGYLEVKGKAEVARETLEEEIRVLDELDRGETQG